MRISSNRADPDYRPDAWQFDVLLNGVLQCVSGNGRIIVAADEEAGTIQFRRTQVIGGTIRYVMVDGRPIVCEMTGRVELRRP